MTEGAVEGDGAWGGGGGDGRCGGVGGEEGVCLRAGEEVGEMDSGRWVKGGAGRGERGEEDLELRRHEEGCRCRRLDGELTVAPALFEMR